MSSATICIVLYGWTIAQILMILNLETTNRLKYKDIDKQHNFGFDYVCMTTENISWSISMKKMLQTWRGVKPTTSWSPVGRASN